MYVQFLTSKENPLVKQIRRVARRSARSPADLVLAEGIRVLEEVVSSDHKIEAVLVTQAFGVTRREKSLLERFRSREVRISRISDRVLKSLSGVLAPQGAVALVRLPERDIRVMSSGANPLIVCACGLQDPGNLGTLIRTAAASGASAVCTTAGSVSSRNPKCIRSSAGAYFRIPVLDGLPTKEILDFCRSRSMRIFRTDPKAKTSYLDADFRKPLAILLGNESHGLVEPEWTSLPAIRIPMADETESLNVAVAGSVILFEVFRQRRETRRRAPEESSS